MIYIHIGDIVKNMKVPSQVRRYMMHGTNCQGVMGAGIAAIINREMSDACKPYFKKATQNELRLGDYSIGTHSIDPIRASNILSYEKVQVVHLNTQHIDGRHRRPCRYDAIADGVSTLAAAVVDVQEPNTPLPQLHFPLIGCGLGGGIWDIVGNIIDTAMPDHIMEKHLWVLSDKDITFSTLKVSVAYKWDQTYWEQ